MNSNNIQGWNQTKYEEKKKLSKQQKEKPPVGFDKVEQIIKDELKNEGVYEDSYKISKLKGLDNIRKWEKNQNKRDIENSIFISFDADNRVAVVGAGEARLSFPKPTKSSNNMMLKLMAHCDCRWPRDEDKQVIRIVFNSLDGIHRTQVNNLLQCRDGVEFLIGEILLNNNAPIIDTLSHRNWKYDYWNKVRANCYNL